MTLAAGILAGSGVAFFICGAFFLLYARDLVADSEQSSRVTAQWYTDLLTETITTVTANTSAALKVLATPPPPPPPSPPLAAPVSTPAMVDLDAYLDEAAEAEMDARLARRERRAPVPVPPVEEALNPESTIEG